MVQKRDNLDSEIMLTLADRELHLRGIAKELGQSHSTILRRLNRMVEENVLDYRPEGRNKVFFIKKTLQAKNHLFNAERCKQMKLLKKYPKLAVIIDDVLKETGKRIVVIFGSYSDFTAGKNSDIDIFVETRSMKVKEKIESVHSNINVKIGDFDTSSALVKEIIKNHVVLRGIEEFYEKIGFFR